ncbi:hypothetical protein Lal_00001070 [Lupinus albus]|nr:hypothetical protein Lal_00001070 [Lupinus albus]
MDSWERLACYPQGSFYPLSDGPSTRYHRITKPDFRPCSTCTSRSQAPFCLYTLRAISIRAEGTFGRLRYSFGGDRPSQTAHLTLSGCYSKAPWGLSVQSRVTCIFTVPHHTSGYYLADLPTRYPTCLDANFHPRADLPSCVTPSLKRLLVVLEFQPVVHRLRFSASA